MISALRSCPAHAWTPTTLPAAGGCDVSVDQLWGSYLALGGSMSLPGFRRCLDGARFADALEHDLMALALNEHLLDHGHRFPIPSLRSPFIAETGPTAARWPAWVVASTAKAASAVMARWDISTPLACSMPAREAIAELICADVERSASMAAALETATAA